MVVVFMVTFCMVSFFFQDYMCKFWIFFMVIVITFLNPQVSLFMITSVLFHDDITVAYAVGPSVNPSSTEFSLPKPGFF
jgi:hypothetical protein